MSSWMELNGRRLDCNPYLSGAFEAKVLLEKLLAKKHPLHEVTQGGLKGIYHAGRVGRTYVNDPKYGVPFLRSTSILAADLSYLPFILKRQVAATPAFICSRRLDIDNTLWNGRKNGLCAPCNEWNGLL